MVLALQLLVGTAGFGANALFYSLVFLHALAALAGFGSIGFAGTYASGAYLPDDLPRAADREPASRPAQPQSGPAQPVGAPGRPGGETAQPEPGELGGAKVAETVPDYETALRQYEAALREFEASEREGDGGEETGRAGAETGGAEKRTGRAEEERTEGERTEEDTVRTEQAPSAVQDVVAAEVVVHAGPLTTGDAAEQDAEVEEMRRYFAHPARLWGCLVLVPFLGAGALAAQPNGKGFDHPWVFGALAVWLAATLVAGSLVVPSLHQMRTVLLQSDNAAASPAARSSLAIRFARAGRIASRSAALCDILFLVALALMIFRP